MKYFLIALLASSLQVQANETVKQELLNKGLDCNEVIHVENKRMANFIYYDITCKTDRGHNIYQHINTQTATTHYIFDK